MMRKRKLLKSFYSNNLYLTKALSYNYSCLNSVEPNGRQRFFFFVIFKLHHKCFVYQKKKKRKHLSISQQFNHFLIDTLCEWITSNYILLHNPHSSDLLSSLRKFSYIQQMEMIYLLFDISIWQKLLIHETNSRKKNSFTR